MLCCRSLDHGELRAESQGRASRPVIFVTNYLSILEKQCLLSVFHIGTASAVEQSAYGHITHLWRASDDASAADLAALNLIIAGVRVSVLKQVNLDEGDMACIGDTCTVLVDGKTEFALLDLLFRLHIESPADLLTLRTVTGDDSPDFEFAVVRFYENVYDCRPGGSACTRARGSRPMAEAIRALGLTKALARVDTGDGLSTRTTRLGHPYMTFPWGSNAPVFGFTAVKSFVKRARMWLDESDTGRYQCFYADV